MRDKGQRRKWRVLRVAFIALAGLALLVLLLLIASLWYARSRGGRERLRRLVVEQVRGVAPGFDLAGLGGDYTSTLELNGVTLHDRFGGEAIRVRTVRLHYDLSGLLRRRLRVVRVAIEAPRVVLREVRGGSTNLAQLLLPATDEDPASETAAPSPSNWTVELEHLGIRGASFVDERAPGGAAVRDLHVALAGALRESTATLRLERLAARVRLPDGRELDISTEARARLERWTQIEAGLTLAASGLLPQPVHLALKASGTLDHLLLDLNARLADAGTAQVAGWVEPLRRSIRYELRATLRELKPQALAAELPAMRLNLRLEGNGEGIPLDSAASARVALELERSAIAGIALEQATLTGRVRGENWTLERLRVQSRAGRVEASGSGSLEQVDGRLEIALPDLARLPLARRGPKLEGALALDVAVKGHFDDRLTATVRGTLDGVGFEGARIDKAALKAKLRGLPSHPRGQLSLTASGARWPDPPLRIDKAEVRFDGQPRSRRSRLTATLRGIRLPPASSRAGGASGAPRMDARLEAVTEARVLRATLKGRFSGGKAGTRLRADAVLPLVYAARSQLPSVSRTRPVSATVALNALSLRLLRHFGMQQPGLDGQLGLNARLGGTLAAPTLQAELRLREGKVAAFDRLSAAVSIALDEQLSVRAEAKRADASLAQLQGALQLSSRDLLNLGRRPLVALGRAPLQLGLQAGPLALESLASLDPGLAGLRGSARAAVRLSGSLFLPRADLELSVDGARAGRRDLGDARLTARLTGQQARIDGELALVVGGQPLLRGRGALERGVEQLARDSRRVAGAPLNLEVEIQRTQLRELSRFDELLAHVDGGTLAGRVRVEGTVAAPRTQANLRISELRAGGGLVGDVEAEARATPGSLGGRISLRQAQGGMVSARATVALRNERRTIDAELKASALDMAFVSALVPDLQRTGGRLALQATIRGALNKPQVRGQVQLVDGRLRARAMSELKGIGLRASFDPERVQIERLRVGSGGGELVASGHATLRELMPDSLALTARATDFRLGVSPIADATLDGRVEVRAQRKGKTLQTRVTLADGVIRVPQIASQRSFHASSALPDIIFVDRAARADRAREKRKAARTKVAKSALDLRVQTDSLMLRSDELDVEVATDTRVRAEAGAGLRVFGVTEIRRGQVTILGNRYQVDRATVRFSGKKDPDPAIDLRLRHDFAEGTVFITLRGTIADNELTLSSEPGGYDQSQLLSLVLTGRIDPRADESGGDKSMAVASAVGQAVFGLLANRVAGQVGIDVTRIGVAQTQDEQTNETRLRAEAEIGKYITRRLYVAYRRVVGGAEDENANEAISEYRISARWLLMALFGDRGVGNLDLLWTYRY